MSDNDEELSIPFGDTFNLEELIHVGGADPEDVKGFTKEDLEIIRHGVWERIFSTYSEAIGDEVQYHLKGLQEGKE